MVKKKASSSIVAPVLSPNPSNPSPTPNNGKKKKRKSNNNNDNNNGIQSNEIIQSNIYSSHKVSKNSIIPPLKDEPSTLKQRITDGYYRYNLETALYMLDPWEKAFFNGFVIVFLSASALFLYNSGKALTE